MLCLNIIRQRNACRSIMFTNEAAFMPRAKLHEARLTNDSLLKAEQFLETNSVALAINHSYTNHNLRA